jgi:hypothetical protein
MPTSFEDQRFVQQSTTVFHPTNQADKTAMAGLRAIVEPNKGQLRRAAARAPFDAIMEHVAIPEGVTFEAGIVGGVPGGGRNRRMLSQAQSSSTFMVGGSTGARRKPIAIWSGTSRFMLAQWHSRPTIALHRNIPFRQLRRTCAPAMPASSNLASRRSPSSATLQAGLWRSGSFCR